ncbi:MAG TPA: hypothetical protein PKA98_20295 [Acidimicrobiales bacterium]|nr:hypothetical protein [Acidimicrobiales bacterium]
MLALLIGADRRRVLRSAVAFSLVAALAACGQSSDTSSSTTVAAPATTTTAELFVPDEPAETTVTEPTEGSEGGVVAGVDFGVLDLPPGEPYDEYVTLVDDTDTLEVEVPAAWSDTITEPRGIAADEDFEQNAWPYVSAAVDQDEFAEGWSSPGVFTVNKITATSERTELDELDERIDLAGNCVEMSAFDYDDGSYTGLAELWQDCTSAGAAVLAISTLVEGTDHLLTVVQLLTDADIEAATRVIETFSFIGS